MDTSVLPIKQLQLQLEGGGGLKLVYETYLNGKRHTSGATKRNEQNSGARGKYIPFDRVRKKTN